MDNNYAADDLYERAELGAVTVELIRVVVQLHVVSAFIYDNNSTKYGTGLVPGFHSKAIACVACVA